MPDQPLSKDLLEPEPEDSDTDDFLEDRPSREALRPPPPPSKPTSSMPALEPGARIMIPEDIRPPRLPSSLRPTKPTKR